MGHAHEAQRYQVCSEAPEPTDAPLLTQVCGSHCEAKIRRQCLTMCASRSSAFTMALCPGSAAQDQEGSTEDFTKAVLSIAPAEEQTIASLWSLGLEFQAHQQTPQSAAKLLLQKFHEPAKAMDALLARIQEDERRATLLLSFLALHPLCYTRCCCHEFCFNCKRGSHHSVCDDGGAINWSENKIQCRSCRATLVKVEGCASVACLCGFGMSWDEELTLFRRYLAKKMVAKHVFFDPELFVAWCKWRSTAPELESVLASAYSDYRPTRLETKLARSCYVLGPWIRRFVQRWRFRRNLKRIPAAYMKIQVRRFVSELTATHKDAQTLEPTSDSSKCLWIPAASMAKGRGSRLAERRERGRKARKSSQERRLKKTHKTRKSLLMYVPPSAANSPQEIWDAAK